MPSGNNSISASPPMGWAWSRLGTAEATSHEGLRQTRLTRLMNDEAFARLSP